MNYDYIIRGGTIFDGTGNPSLKKNIYINEGKISKITSLNIGNAEEIIDAKGLVVSPGFIDIHQHSDYTIFEVPKCDSYIHQGVTTVGVSNCGLSLAPISNEYKKEIIKYNDAFTLGFAIPYKWNSFGEYLNYMEQVKPGVNLWTQVGHCTLRAAVMGYEGRKANIKEINEMKELLEQGMKDGAFGFSTGWYAPGYWAETDEIIELAKVVAKYEGIYTTHLRELNFGVEEAFSIGEIAKIPIEIAHYEGTDIEKTRAKGIDVTYDAYAYNAGSSLLGQVLPYWAYEGGVDSMLEAIQDPSIREKIKKEINTSIRDWNEHIIAYLGNKDNKHFEGKSIAEISKIKNMDPIDVVCELLIQDNGNGMYVLMDGRKQNYVFTNLINPYNYIMSDGWGLAPYEPIRRGLPHPRCYGAFPRVLGRYVRDCGTISLAEAIRKMTWGPAQKMGLNDRGILRENLWADITIFNKDIIEDKATFANPHQFPIGVEYVFVNGKKVIDHGNHTEIRAGKILRKKNH